MSAPNRNTLWATIVVDELARAGLEAVCIAPGSRSTPLTLAFADHPNIATYSHIDERSASFFALGLALATQKPVALICSSGTATANFFPAVIEARYSHVPLIVLTADRPHELRHSGANQTVDQVNLYGGHVRWFVDVAIPESDPSDLLIRSLRTLANRAYAKANTTPQGAVHLNFPFRKPLEPVEVATDHTTHADAMPRQDRAFTSLQSGIITPTQAHIDTLASLLQNAQRPLIVCGTLRADSALRHALIALAQATHTPIFADPLSNIRFGSPQSANIITGYDTYLRAGAWQRPDLVLHFGAMPTSQALEDYLNHGDIARYIAINDNGAWSDANHRLTDHWTLDATLLCAQTTQALADHNAASNAWLAAHQAADHTYQQIAKTTLANHYFDGAIINAIVQDIPDDSQIFVSNSLPVRELDQFGNATDKNIAIYCNRGASGIDGIISSALGVAAAHPMKHTTLITGDLSFYHDMNGLMAIKRLGIRATIVLINNNGGGIFYRLPIAAYDPPFNDLFLTPHGLAFEHAARLYNIDYAKPENREQFRAAYRQSTQSDNANIIEIETDYQTDAKHRANIINATREALKNSAHSPFLTII